ncbi:hypothetical protein Emtol_2374 [Emticicia oligotrophica DSM 17448]|uniref:Uncharacterized protein n=1 Tax=Emticicia oligotrophica (strain DSM 17448 / CIP 109782 / MTCC 6937 / GPTSA100-15) TaxID=929562 RepID=A0ABM5N214_EMTOG|nr:hypothetical protein Emtol_2374 [Emticicia oligotrophica DSM 17448]
MKTDVMNCKKYVMKSLNGVNTLQEFDIPFAIVFLPNNL